VSAIGAASASAATAGPVTVYADVDPASVGVRLLNRATFGVTDADWAEFVSLGYEGWLERQLNPGLISDTALEQRLAGQTPPFPALTTLTMTGEQLYALNNGGQIQNELIEATILRAALSRRQLFEKMVEFWSDHFSMDITIGSLNVLKTLDDRDVIRANALGNFRDLLHASARSPAMLQYLNNDQNTLAAPNENYGRELLELHTLGASAGYTQADVIAVSRCLTGWTRWGSTTNPSNLRGTFRYNSGAHDNGQKVLSPLFNLTGTGNLVIPAGQPAMFDGNLVLDILANHPATARFVCTKMARRFVGEDVPGAVVDAAVAAWLDNGSGVRGDIKAVLRVLLSANVLASATPRYKRPFHLTISAIRGLNATVTTTSSLRTRLVRCGHLPFMWGPPDGYPDTLEYWSGQQLPRWNFGAELVTTSGGAGNGITGVAVDVAGLLGTANTPAEVVNRLDARLTRGAMSTMDRNTIQSFLAQTALTTTRRADAAGLAVDSPSFQWY
jgi:uncharacterized protein (DUF1800 family)